MKIVWDLDGVIRDLNGHLMRLYGGKYPTTWNHSYNNMTICKCIDNDINILIDAPPTAYYKIMKKHFDAPEIWTSQPEHWRELTTKWLNKYVGVYAVRFLKPEEKEKELERIEDIVLIEDSPNFKNYEKILLIDRPYNQEVKEVIRVFGTRHLNNLVELMKGA